MKNLIKTIFITACIALVFGISAYITLSWVIRSEETVIVPRLQGKSAVEVLTVLSGMDLNAKVSGTEYSDTVPKDHIVGQNPPPGTEIKQGRNIRITISKGSAQVAMPDLSGLPLNQVQVVLEENGLCRRHSSYIHSTRTEKDRVISQFPASGAIVPRATCANLLVSLGPPAIQYAMPDIRGKTMVDAVAAVERIGMKLGVLQTRQGFNTPKQSVMEQTPAPGSRVTSGSPVDLVINQKSVFSGNDSSRPIADTWWLAYRLPWGFLNRHLEIRQKASGEAKIIFDDFVLPGSEIVTSVTSGNDPVFYVYIDRELADVIISKAPSFARLFSKQTVNDPLSLSTDWN